MNTSNLRPVLFGIFLAVSTFAALTPSWAGDSTNFFEKPYVFENEESAKIKLSQWQNEDVVVAFAFTTCRITCPQVMRQLSKIQKIMDQKSVKGEILFISIDPENDSPARLAIFKKDHKITSSRWHFLRGNLDETKKLAQLLNFGFNTSDEHIWHDRKVFVVGKDGQVRATLKGFDADLSRLF